MHQYLICQDRRLLRSYAHGRQQLVVCFHHAGAGASTFAAWPRYLADWADLVLVQLPGREDRIIERLDDPLPVLSTRIATQLASTGHERLLLFGHSMGATLAWWVACRLWHQHQRCARVIVSGQSPHPANVDRLSAPGSLEDWFDLIGTRLPDALRNREMQMVSRALLESDIGWMRREFTRRPPGPLPLEIHGLCASDDRLVSAEAMMDWRTQTTAHFALTCLPGGHLHLVTDPAPVVDFVQGLLQ